MHDATLQRGLEWSRTGSRGIERCGLVCVRDLAIFAHVEAGSGQDDVEFVSPPCERRSVTNLVHRVHRAVDGHDEVVAELTLVLRTGQRVEPAANRSLDQATLFT
ncbi:hypothetical protein [Xanthomonas theicola]|uniref:hypothetical protein n=1 Tax=Xanthomonas theicola TaxID=56464 RepID=UPI001FE83A02|nr:hypothetical protein [Xanthomonas theicola]